MDVPPSLSTRVAELWRTLDRFNATDQPGAQTADIFDAIVVMAKQQFPDDPVIATLTPAVRNAASGVNTSAGSMMVALGQIRVALGESGPSIG